MDKLIVIFIYLVTFISTIGECDQQNKWLPYLTEQLKLDDYQASAALKSLMRESEEGWEIILHFSHKEPERFVHLSQEWSMQIWAEHYPQYFAYLYQRAELDEVVSKDEARLWDTGWFRKSLEVVSSNTRIGELESKTSSGARRIAIEFIKRKAGQDFGFLWNEEPDSVNNKKAITRINQWLASPRFARVNQGGDFVIASIVNVRKEPSATAPIVGRLRIGIRVDVLQTLDDWSEVVYIDGALERLHGYIATSFLAPRPLTFEEAITNARTALEHAELEEALVFGERAFSIDGSSMEAAKLLKSLYQQLQRSENLAYLEAFLQGRRTEYLAVCSPSNIVGESPRIVLLSKYSRSSGLQKVIDVEEASGSLLYSWFYTTASGEQLPVEPGVLFFNAKIHSLSFSNEYFFSIGNCLQSGAIYSTAPVLDVIKKETNWQNVIDLLKPLKAENIEPPMRESAWVQGIDSYRVQDEYPVNTVTFHYIVEYASHHDAGYISLQPLNLWVLSDANGSILKTIGHGGEYLDSVAEISWARWKFISGSKIGIILHKMISGPTTYDVVVISPDGKVRSLEVVVAEGSC